MLNALNSYPVIQYRYSSAVIYYLPISPYSLNWLQRKEIADRLKNNKTYSGKVSPHTKKRIRKSISLLLQTSPETTIYNPITDTQQKFQINFITLTISNNTRQITASEGYQKALSKFLDWLRKVHKVNLYVWKAELQERGQLHYHITTNKFILFQQVKDKWNTLQKKAGWLDEYTKTTGHQSPNSTDIHSVLNIRDLEAYLVKEISKSYNDEEELYSAASRNATLLPDIIWGNILSCRPAQVMINTNTQGKIWDCSTELKGKKYFSEEMTEAHERKIFEHMQKNTISEVQTDYCTILKINHHVKKTLMPQATLQAYKSFIDSIRKECNIVG